MILAFWSLATAFLGDRTSGIAGLIVSMFLLFADEGKTKRIKVLPILLIVVFGSILLFSISFISSFREGHQMQASSILDILSSSFGEIGSSYFPLVLLMNICPSIYGYTYGSSYFYSTISGFLPDSLDFTGTVDRWINLSFEPRNWISLNYDYTYGVGYSLCAESYANFGYFGFFVIFFIGVIIFRLLSSNKKNKFTIYTSTILLFEFLTLPRRNYYYIVNHFFYCVLVIGGILVLFCKRKVETHYSMELKR